MLVISWVKGRSYGDHDLGLFHFMIVDFVRIDGGRNRISDVFAKTDCFYLTFYVRLPVINAALAKFGETREN